MMKNKVLKDAIKNRELEQKRKANQVEDFKQRYNKTEIYKFPSVEEINTEKHFYMPKDFITTESHTKAAIAVYPVLCSKSDFAKETWIQMSRETIGVMAGINATTVDKGLDNLLRLKRKWDGSRYLKRKMERKGSRRYFVYSAGFIRKDDLEENKGKYIIFHTAIIESGIWAKLSPRAKTLYLTLRSIGKFDWDGLELGNWESNRPIRSQVEDIYGEEYKNREWDYCDISLKELCQLANIESSNTKSVFDQLEKHHLVKRSGNYFRIYLNPFNTPSLDQED